MNPEKKHLCLLLAAIFVFTALSTLSLAMNADGPAVRDAVPIRCGEDVTGPAVPGGAAGPGAGGSLTVPGIGGFSPQYSAEAAGAFPRAVCFLPVEYTLSVDGDETSLWALEIGEDMYFKLRDVAMALSGTEKEFDVVWVSETREVDLFGGSSYTPTGGELATPDLSAYAAAENTVCRICAGGSRYTMTAYLADGAHYVRLCDLAAVIGCSSSCCKDSRSAAISTVRGASEASDAGGDR